MINKLIPSQQVFGIVAKKIVCSTLRNVPPSIRYPLIYSDDAILNTISKKRMHIWHIAAPKSGSTWLDSILNNLLKWNTGNLVSNYDRKEQYIDMRKLMAFPSHDNLFSVHQHCRYCTETENFINRVNVIPIFQHRNIFDTIISIFDHMNQESVEFPMAYMDNENWNIISNQKRIDYVIDLVTPWYFNFYAGWLSSAVYKEGKLICIGYEALKNDTFSEIKKLTKSIGLNYDDDRIQDAIILSQESFTRKNKAVIGRGEKLNFEQKERVVRFSKYYPNIDFSIIGI